MSDTQQTVRSAVRRARAEDHLLISLAAFAGSVIATRLFLDLAGYPQLGNNVLHIAHAMWGGLLLLIAALLPLLLANRWARTLSAVFSGVGVGLFIDEVGKFITQTNDYFFPPAAPLIYAIFLVLVLVFFLIRRKRRTHPRAEMYRALSSLGELLDNNLDTRELEELLVHLEAGQQADQPHVAGLAGVLRAYLQDTDIPLLPANPSPVKRLGTAIELWGRRIGRHPHRFLIVLAMVILVLGMVSAIVLPLVLVIAPETLGQRLLTWLISRDDIQTTGSRFWFYLRIVLEGVVGLIAVIAIAFFATDRERRGSSAALLALSVSLGGVVLLSFYLDQFSATVTALLQLGVLFVIVAYRRWYLAATGS